MVLKVSGFSEEAWGSRGVYVGHDLAQEEWKAALEKAQREFTTDPYLLQEFAQPMRVEHPIWNEEAGEVQMMEGRARLCPYYFVQGKRTVLGGVLATVVPVDKKVVHGMSDATLVPCCVE